MSLSFYFIAEWKGSYAIRTPPFEVKEEWVGAAGRDHHAFLLSLIVSFVFLSEM